MDQGSKAPEVITSYKGFDNDLKCRGHQFEVGQTYEIDGEIIACERGFHACEHPLNVFSYYPPATSRFAVVTQSGAISRHGDDTKIASARITVEAEIKLPELIQAAVKWVFDRANWKDGPVATGDNECATASGTRGAATASGTQGAATASGEYSVAMASGWLGKARASAGCAIFLAHRNDDGKILHVFAGIAGRDGVKPDVWYRLSDDGVLTEIADQQGGAA